MTQDLCSSREGMVEERGCRIDWQHFIDTVYWQLVHPFISLFFIFFSRQGSGWGGSGQSKPTLALTSPSYLLLGYSPVAYLIPPASSGPEVSLFIGYAQEVSRGYPNQIAKALQLALLDAMKEWLHLKLSPHVVAPKAEPSYLSEELSWLFLSLL